MPKQVRSNWSQPKQSVVEDSSVFNGFCCDDGWGSSETICSGTSSWDTPPLAHDSISCLMWWHVGNNQLHWKVEMLEYTHTITHARADRHVCALHKYTRSLSLRPTSGWEFWLTRTQTGSRQPRPHKFAHKQLNLKKWNSFKCTCYQPAPGEHTGLAQWGLFVVSPTELIYYK